MVLLFLRDWRSVIVVVLNIPFALLGASSRLWLTGQTINLMTLGGLALAVGILVDEATVEVENIHTQFEHTPNIARAVRLGNHETAVPRLLAMLCILAVFIPSFFMEGAARALFVPLSLAVGFAMVASLFPVQHIRAGAVGLAAAPLPPAAGRSQAMFSFARLRNGICPAFLRMFMRVRWMLRARLTWLSPRFVVWLVGSQLGREIFPHRGRRPVPAPPAGADGTRIEVTEQMAVQDAGRHQGKGGPDNVAISLGYVGLIPSSYPINTIYLWMSGPEEAVLRVALKPGSGVRVERAEAGIATRAAEPILEAWLRERLAAEKTVGGADAAERVSGLKLSFEPADIVNEVMSFGSPTPIEVAVSGPKLAENRAYAEKIRSELERIPSLRDLQFVQPLDYPAIACQGGPPAGRRQRRHDRGGRQLAGGGHLLQPLRGAQLLGRSRTPASATRCRSRSRSNG